MARPYTETYFKGTEEEQRIQWLQARTKGLGGSDAATVLGFNNYKTPYALWLEKTGRVQPEDISDKEAVYWGNVLEDVVAAEYAKRHPEQTVRRKNAMLISKERPWQFANVDRVITDEQGRRGILEIKTAGTFRADDWLEGIPNYYLPQPIHYLAVTGYEFFSVAVLIGGQHYKEFTYEREEDDIALINEQEAAFWSLVVNDEQPALQASDSSTLFEQYPQAGDEYVQMLDDDLPELLAYQQVSAKIKRLTDNKNALAAQLKDMIGSSKGIITPTQKITWSRSVSKTFDSKGLKRDNPELFEQYTTEKPKDLGLRITEIKE